MAEGRRLADIEHPQPLVVIHDRSKLQGVMLYEPTPSVPALRLLHTLVSAFPKSYMLAESGSAGRAAQRKDGFMPSAHETIDAEVKSNDVVLFMKGTPQFPMCGFSGQCVQILDYLGVPYKGVNVLEDAELRQGIKEYTNWPTIPQLYVKGEFVGGCDIVREMFQSGELATQMASAGLPVKQAAVG